MITKELIEACDHSIPLATEHLCHNVYMGWRNAAFSRHGALMDYLKPPKPPKMPQEFADAIVTVPDFEGAAIINGHELQAMIARFAECVHIQVVAP